MSRWRVHPGAVAALLSVLASIGVSPGLAAARPADGQAVTRQRDVVYGRKFGVALTMDVFTPAKGANGAAAVFVVSGGWYSAHEVIDAAAPAFVDTLVGRGYTVFAVVHGSQPKFTIPEILQDMNRAIRYIRHHAADYKIDPDRIGIYGGSAGGHLSLMQGLAGPEAGDPAAKDPVDRASARVRAVACFYPPTDFLNYGKPGEVALGRGVLKDFKAPFDFQELDPKTRSFVPVTDEQKVLEIGRQISPVAHVSGDDPPTLIIHGDADQLVPIQQAEVLVEKLKEAGVVAELARKPGAGHGWPGLEKDVTLIGDWFDKHLGGRAENPAGGGRVMFEDSFDAAELKAGWNWLRENPGSWRLRDGAMEIRVEPGRGETVKNVLWRDLPDSAAAYAVEVTVTNRTKPTTQWEQAGLILYRGGEPAVKLGKEFVDGKLVIIPGEVPLDAETVRLRLSVKGDDYIAQYQPDARGEFLTAAAGRLAAGGRIPAAGKLPAGTAGGRQVSLQCFEGPPDAEHWVRFDDVRVTEISALPEARK